MIQGVYDGVSTPALDDLAAETAAYLTTQHPDWSKLAARSPQPPPPAPPPPPS